MEYKRDGCTFTVPDRPNVEQQLMYYSAAGGRNFFLRYWMGARALIEKWECPLLPDPNTDLATLTDPRITDILIWAGLEVMKHMNALEELPKNS